MSGSREFHYNVNGKRQDEDIHNPILEEGDAVVAFVSTFNQLRRMGWSVERISGTYVSLYQAAKVRNLI